MRRSTKDTNFVPVAKAAITKESVRCQCCVLKHISQPMKENRDPTFDKLIKKSSRARCIKLDAEKAGGRKKTCRNGRTKTIGRIWSQVLVDDDTRNVFMWKSTDFLRHVVGEVEERGAITITYDCEHCKQWKTKTQKHVMNGWLCGTCKKPYYHRGQKKAN